jgi:hypothetical protein
MKGSDLIQIAAAVYGIRWFDSLRTDLGLEDTVLSELTKADSLPGPIEYALRDIATKYMVRVESMQVHSNIQDALLTGRAEDPEQAAYMAGVVKGMTLLLKAIHGEPDELKEIAKDKTMSALTENFGKVLN